MPWTRRLYWLQSLNVGLLQDLHRAQLDILLGQIAFARHREQRGVAPHAQSCRPPGGGSMLDWLVRRTSRLWLRLCSRATWPSTRVLRSWLKRFAPFDVRLLATCPHVGPLARRPRALHHGWLQVRHRRVERGIDEVPKRRGDRRGAAAVVTGWPGGPPVSSGTMTPGMC